MKRAFTLIEVNLAILIMAGGILSVVVLYTLGFREARQSREDLATAAYADAVMSPLVAAFSAMTADWEEDFKGNEGWAYPSENGWGAYLDGDGKVVIAPEGKASSAFGAALGRAGSVNVNASFPDPGNFKLGAAGLVVMHEKNSSVVKIGFRASKKASTLLSAPLYYTEVRFQGKQK